MNTRPTRVPAPPQHYIPVEEDRPNRPALTADPRDRDHEITVEPVTNSLPATRAHESPVNEVAPTGEAQPPLPKTEYGNLLAAIASVMMEIEPVEKGGWNKFQSYAFARMQDLLVTITPLMGKHGIVVFQHEEGREMFDNGRAIAVRYRFTIVHKSGEVWFERPLQTGLSNCRNTKDGFDDKALNKCHTAARKYFLMSLFQIPTEDMEDGDGEQGGNGQQPRQRPQGQRRVVPRPDGKLPPHAIAIIDGELPAAWATRFNGFVAKAESAAEVDKWYGLNSGVFDKLKGRFQDVYDNLLDAMDARIAAFDSVKKDDPISSGPSSGGFPGDTPMKRVAPPPADDGAIPWALDRRLSEGDREWLMELQSEFERSEDLNTLASNNESIMAPAKDTVSPYVWQKACDLMDEHIARINRG